MVPWFAKSELGRLFMLTESTNVEGTLELAAVMEQRGPQGRTSY